MSGRVGKPTGLSQAEPGGMRLHWPAGRASDNPEITFRFNPDGLAVRDRLIASAIEARSDATTKIDAAEGESAGPKDDAHA